MQLYNQFIDFCNSLMKYITTQNLVYGALISLSFFLVWTAFAVATSSIRKFYVRCDKLEWHISRNKVGYGNINSIDGHCRKISRSFFHCWNKFKKSNGKKPSDFLTKRDAFDAEISSGMLNHGKTLMKTYIGITTVLLFILNLAQIGKDATVTFNILVEAMFLPFIYYVVMMLVYFIANLIKQQIYIIATAHFYALVDSLDKCFDSNDYFEETRQVFYSNVVEPTTEVRSKEVEELQPQEELPKEPEQDAIEEAQEPVETELEEEPNPQTEPEVQEDNDFSELENEETEVVKVQEEQNKEPAVNPVVRNWEAEENLDYYDVFKKKNINVDKYINEIPKEEEYGSPFINVDREFIPSDEMTAEIQEVEDEKWEAPVVETNEENEDVQEDSLAEFDNVGEQTDSKDLNEETSETEIQEEIQDTPEENEQAEDDFQEVEDLVDNAESETDIEEELDEIEDGLESEIDIQEEQNDIFEESEEDDDDFDFFNVSKNDDNEPDADFFADEESNYDEEDKQNDFRSQLEQNLNDSTKEIDSKLEDEQADANIDLSALVGEFKQTYHNDDENLTEQEQEVSETINKTEEPADNIGVSSADAKEIYAKINDLEELIHSAIADKNADVKTEKPIKSKKSRKGKTKMTRENEGEKKTRGRPKMQTIDENLVITTEEQFEDILSRAEKLMRKSEQGLSASQSKRIEKELKIMMDAMNKYKEG